MTSVRAWWITYGFAFALACVFHRALAVVLVASLPLVWLERERWGCG